MDCGVLVLTFKQEKKNYTVRKKFKSVRRWWGKWDTVFYRINYPQSRNENVGEYSMHVTDIKHVTKLLWLRYAIR